MNKNTPTFIGAAMLLATAISLVFGISAARKQRDAVAEADQLRLQVSELQQKKNKPLLPEATAAVPTESAADTNRVAELEAELTVLQARLAKAQEDRRPQREGGESWEERMARMQAEDPEGYAQMLAERQERRDQIRYSLAERTANFMELDTGFMTDDERVNHEMLIQKMGDIWELTEQMQDPEAQPDRETMRELFGLMRETQPLMDIERNTMFKQLANDLGLEGEDAAAFSGYVEGIIETTTIRPPRGGRGGRGGGGGR